MGADGGQEGFRALALEATKFVADPLGYVYWAYPWGSQELPYDGPDNWQIAYLGDLGNAIREREWATVQTAVGAANGVGKTAVIAWLIDWGLMTWPLTRGKVTANTATQLKSVTWAEIARWHRLSLASKHLLQVQATSVTGPQEEQQWRIDAVPWSLERPEAVAGLHNQNRRIIMFTEEASGVPDPIWEYQEASMARDNTQIIWAVFGNTTRNTGRFRECWRKFDARWRKVTDVGIKNGRVDARDCRHSNKKKIAEWIADYGEDHDFVRVRVKAEFPRVGDMQFFSSEQIAQARIREVDNAQLSLIPATISVDCAAGGSDSTVITCRRGVKFMWIKRYPYTDDTMGIVGLVIDAVRNERNMYAICVDANGVGKGVADRLSELRGTPQGAGLPTIVHVYGAANASDTIRYRNLRSELFDRFRQWLRTGSLEGMKDDRLLFEEMEGIGHGFSPTMQLTIETKKDMKERLGHSPDGLDSCIYSFADVVYAQNIQRRHKARPLVRTRWK